MCNKLRRLLCLVIAFAAAAPVHALLPIQHWQARSGARVYFVENRDLPMFDVSVDFPAGSVYDTHEKSGLAMLTRRLLRLGAGGMSDNEIARRMADVGAQIGGRFDSDRAGLSLRTLTGADELKQALEVLALMLQRPDFPAAVLEREKVRIMGSLKEADTKPETLLNRHFNALAYSGHAYGLRGSGEVDTVGGITRNEVADFYRRHYSADEAVVAMMGNVSRSEAEAIAEMLTADLVPRGAQAPLSAVPSLTRAETRIVAHPALQSHLLIGAPGISRDDPDYFPLFVGNHILGGGGFVSRITEEVRQKRGLAYSAYSYFSPMRERGPFVIGLQTRKDQAGEALAVVRATLKEFLAQGPTAVELTEAKQNLIGGFPLRIDSNRKILDYLGTIGFYRLPLTYLDDFVSNIEKVTVADIRAAFARRVDADRMITVIVGGEASAPGAGR